MNMVTRLLLLVLMISFSNTFGRIRNGYEGKVQVLKSSLQNLKLKLSEESNLSFIQSLRIKSEIRDLITLISYYELTQELISQLRIVTPDVYNEIDSIRDKRGRPTDIFIKLIPREQARVPLIAASFFSQAQTDEDTNVSVYGEYSVSIDIFLSQHSLFLLCHELGHIKYIVPNLASYSKFYKNYYRMNNLSYIGHNPRDQSGKSAYAFEKRFFKGVSDYLRVEGKRPESAIAVMQKIRKNNRNLEAGRSSQSVVYVTEGKFPTDYQLFAPTACRNFSKVELILKEYEEAFALHK